MLFLLADITILLDSLPGSKTGVGVAAATAGIATDTSCAITLPPGPLPCRDYNTNDNIGEGDKQCSFHLNFLDHFAYNFKITENTLFINSQQDDLFSC